MLISIFKKTISVVYFIIILQLASNAQNSILVNFGTNSCNGSGAPSFSLIKDPFGNASSSLTTCNVGAQVPDIFAVFIAYNPKNNKLYLADIRTGFTKTWAMDIGLPENINCPQLDSLPDNTYSYVSNNFEFDNNGDLWSFSDYNDTTGQCNIDQFDLNTGTVINTRIVQFPNGNFPTTISSGDLTILPNGRMFATLGSNPSRLYEITNYSSASSYAIATYLTTLPLNCFGIAYLNGQLEITGTDFSGTCYYYKYEISSNTLDSAVTFQDGQLPIDNTSISPSIGVAKQLTSAQKINATTAAITYNIYVKNLGNVALNNINVSDNLAAIYGAKNISNISLSFVPGNNDANLLLNSSYNGNTDTNMLAPNQNLVNQTSSNTDYFFQLQLSFTVTNLQDMIYENSAIGSATIGGQGSLSFINVADSSNNGPASAIDPNNDGNANEPGENTPTPFNFGTLPVKFISINAILINSSTAIINWKIAIPTTNSDYFTVENSTDGITWSNLANVPITNTNQGFYQYIHSNIPPGNLYYRVKETDIDGQVVYSTIAILRNNNSTGNFTIYPNPANNIITIFTPTNVAAETKIYWYDLVGKLLATYTLTGNNVNINTSLFAPGTYLVKMENDSKIINNQKIIILHH